MEKDSSSARPTYSPSDLLRFVESPFASWMARYELERPDSGIVKDPPDPMNELLSRLGEQHEARVKQELIAKGLRVVTVDNGGGDDAAFEQTLAAMADGAEVIAGACLRQLPFRGYADFLVRCERPSKFGAYSYQVWEAKLALEMKMEFATQLCCYSEMLEVMQGVRPEFAAVVLGNMERESLKVGDYYDFYFAEKQDFLTQQLEFDAGQMPDPFQSASHGDWSRYVDQLRQERDHLSKVANIRRDQIAKLEQAGIKTMAALASSEDRQVPKLKQESLETLKQQAIMQVRAEKSGSPEAIPRRPRKGASHGLAALPPHDPADLFWDLEGYPLEPGGLEYLWGCIYLDGRGEIKFWERWAHDREQEQQAFVDFIQWAHERWRSNPAMHIYHYAHYEVTACKRLMERYGACEPEIDELLGNHVLVDLYKIVRRGLVAGTPGYSLKNLERIYYGEKRDTSVATGDDSVVEYAKWRETQDGKTWRSSKILKSIRDYNKKDCESTLALTKWLREIQSKAGIKYSS